MYNNYLHASRVSLKLIDANIFTIIIIFCCVCGFFFVQQMALKIWTFLLVMSLPAAERGRGFGSLAATVLGNIDYHKIQQKLFSPNSISDGGNVISK